MILNCNFLFLKDLEDNSRDLYACEAINFTNKLQHLPINYVTNLHIMGQRDRDVKVFNIKQQLCLFLPMKIENFFPHLQEIEVSWSGLKQVHRDNFSPLPKLMMAIFPGNEIEILSGDLFVDNPRLTHIDFSQNRLKFIDKNIFNNLFHLKYLAFDDNEFYEGFGMLLDEVDVKDEILKNCSKGLHKPERRVIVRPAEIKVIEPPKRDEAKPDVRPPTASPTVKVIETTQVTANRGSSCKLEVIVICCCFLRALYEIKMKF